MAALLSLLSRIGSTLLRWINGIGSGIGWGNIAGWTLAASIPVAYCLIWLGVLTYVFSVLTSWFIGAAPDIFGGSSFPSGAMWLLNQTFPLGLMFGSVTSLLILRVSAAGLLAVAIQASRFLKGK